MQSIKVSWPGRTFALARCSDSQGKKPRGRRTKEERKELVKSFVKKYQNSNNGSFPSLNLTHKEVGGSYYIVREIVREIIQENKVLAPGNSTSKVLNLDDCLQEQLQEYVSPESMSNLSLAINGQAFEEMQTKALYFSAEHHKVTMDIHQTSCEQSFDGNYATSENILEKEFANSNEVTALAHVDDILAGNNRQDEKETCAIEQRGTSKDEGGFNYEHSVEVSLTVSSCSTLDETLYSNTETNMKSQRENGMAGSSFRHAVLEVTIPSLETAATEHTIASDFSEKLEVHLDCFLPSQDIPLSSKSSLGISTEEEFREGPFTGNLEAECTEFISDKNLHSGSVETHFIITNHEPAINISSDTFDDILLVKPEIPLSEMSDSFSSECTIGNVKPLSSANDLNTEQSATVPDKDSGKVEPEPLARTELKHYLSSREKGRDSLLKGQSSISIKDSHMKQDMPEANPIWSAIKGIIDAFVKFWRED